MSQNLSRIKEIYERQVDRVYRTAMMLVKDEHDAEDIVHSVFLTVIEKDIRFSSREHENAWFITATRNRCKDFFKSAWRSRVDLTIDRDDSPEPEGDGEAAYEMSTDRAAVRAALMELPQEQREILFLHYYEGYTVKEVAEMLNMKETKVRSAIASAKKKLSKNKLDNINE